MTAERPYAEEAIWRPILQVPLTPHDTELAAATLQTGTSTAHGQRIAACEGFLVVEAERTLAAVMEMITI